jgi:hypothetical protein
LNVRIVNVGSGHLQVQRMTENVCFPPIPPIQQCISRMNVSNLMPTSALNAAPVLEPLQRPMIWLTLSANSPQAGSSMK